MTKTCSDCGIEKPLADYRLYKLKDGSERAPRNCKTCAGRATKARQKSGEFLYTKPFEKDGVLIRKCTKCNEEKSADKFHKNRNASYGIEPICKECKRAYDATRTFPKRIDRSKKKAEIVRLFKNCEQCGQNFEAHPQDRRFCSNECSGIAKRNRTLKNCEVCDKQFEVADWEIDKKFCSKLCSWKSKKIDCKCLVCGKGFAVSLSKTPNRKTCSRKCYYEYQIKHPVKECLYCKEQFKSTINYCGESKFCSRKCSGLFKVSRQKIACIECSKKFEVTFSRSEIAKFCSHSCYSNNKTIGFDGVNPGRFTRQDWMEKLKYHGYRCYLCKADLADQIIHKEHRKPISRGGANWIANIAPACSHCNLSKNAKTENEYREWLLNKN